MIVGRQKLELDGKPVIERIVVQAPFRFMVDLQNEGCFIYVRAGNPVINSAFGQEQLKPQESVLLNCGNYFADLLKYGTAEEYEILVIHLYPAILRKIYGQEVPSFLKTTHKGFIKNGVSNQVVQRFAESIFFYFENPELVDDELLELKVKELVLLLLKSGSAESLLALFSYLFASREVSVKEIVNNHLFSKLPVEDLASLANMSLSTFNRTFQSIFNETPASYIKEKRLERAGELLRASTLSISEIAYKTCFSDLAHFSRSFKEKFHLSPSDYRVHRRRRESERI